MDEKKSQSGLRAFVIRKPLKALCIVAAIVGLAFLSKGCITSALLMRHYLSQGGYLEDWAKEDGREITGLVYSGTKGLKYDLYIPSTLKSGVNAPLLLLVHGGAWNSGRRQDISYACTY